MTAPFALAALALGAVGLELVERDQVSAEIAAAITGKVRAALEGELGQVVVEGGRRVEVCKAGCGEVRVRAFGGPLHTHLIIEAREAPDHPSVQEACDLPNEESTRWEEILAGKLRVLTDGWVKPLAARPTAAVLSLEPERPAANRSLVPPLALGGAAVGASIAAVAFAISAKNERAELRREDYGAADYGPMLSAMHRHETIAEICVAGAIASAAAAFLVYLLEL